MGEDVIERRERNGTSSLTWGQQSPQEAPQSHFTINEWGKSSNKKDRGRIRTSLRSEAAGFPLVSPASLLQLLEMHHLHLCTEKKKPVSLSVKCRETGCMP